MRGKWTLWTQDAMVRIFPDDPAPKRPAGGGAMTAARGETECFQVGVRTEGLHLNYLKAAAEDLKGPGGARIPAANVDILFAEYVPVKWACADQAPGDVERPAPGFFPDPLLSEWEFDVAETESPPTRSLWVRLRVPHDAKPGVYRGRISVSGGRKRFATRRDPERIEYERKGTVNFSVRVWNFALPERTPFLTTNWFFPTHVADWFKQPMWKPDFWRLIERMADDMAQHRQNVILTPLFGGRTAAEQLIGIARRGRKYVFDFRGFDRWCRIFFKRGFVWIEGHHITAGSHRAYPIWVKGRSGEARKVACANAQDPRYEDFLAQFFAALWDHLGQRGWRDQYVQHISDEPKVPEVERYRRLAQIVRGAAPGIRLYDALTDPELAALVDYPVPLEYNYDRVVRDSGVPRGNIWTYYCCGPGGKWPNRFIQYPLIRVRIFAWLCFQKGIHGFLHWGYNFWEGVEKKVINPWDDPTCHRYSAGDPCVIYPPRDERMLRRQEFAGSIRWEIIRAALEDYEYLRLTHARATAGNREAQAILKEVSKTIAPDWTTYTRSWSRMNALRERMGRLLTKS